MSESKHTPGPWTVGDTRRQNVHERLQPMYEAAVHYGQGPTRGNCLAVVYLGGNGALRSDKESVEANACLIAAAPEVTESLEEALRWIGRLTDREGADDPDVDKWRAALNKAKGGE